MSWNFPCRVNRVGTCREEIYCDPVVSLLHPIARKQLGIQATLAECLLPPPLSLNFGGVDVASSLCGTPVSVGPTSGDLALRVLCHLVAGIAGSSVAVGSNRRSADAQWIDAERSGDGSQRRSHAGGRNAIFSSSGKPDVAGCQLKHATASSGGSSTARTV